MRALRILALILLPVVAVTACEKKSGAATSYDTSAESNQRYLADYAARPGVTKLPDGLMYRVLKAGTGPQVQKNSDVVTVYYKGSLISGKVFDQTKPEEPAQFQAGGLIPGWVEALKLMKTGDTWEIAVPAELGYGADGSGDTIPPDQVLVFTMTLAKVEYAPKFFPLRLSQLCRGARLTPARHGVATFVRCCYSPSPSCALSRTRG